MADADEDLIPRVGPSAEETDLGDETQDFRFLAAVSYEDAQIPKRGEKDFESHATALQANVLQASRDAMHNALSFQRVHTSKATTIAMYHPESNMAYTYSPKGILYTRMGHSLSVTDDPLGHDGRRANRIWLLPEEVLYLLERGTLDVRWPAEEGDEGGIPMSLQAAYAMFIGNEVGGLTFERYSVYAGLKRNGYTLMRAPSWDRPNEPPDRSCYPPMAARSTFVGLFAITSWWRAMFATTPRDNSQDQKNGPVVPPNLYRNYADIYRRLALIEFYDPTKQTDQRPYIAPTDPAPTDPAPTDTTFRITYNVWKPSTSYKKSLPPPPDFYIAVVNGRQTSVPTLEQLGALLETQPYKPPSQDAQLYAKLRNGYKEVVLAIVDQGVTSYLRLADAAFGKERLYERTMQGPGGKRGGRAGGRGRGR